MMECDNMGTVAKRINVGNVPENVGLNDYVVILGDILASYNAVPYGGKRLMQCRRVSSVSMYAGESPAYYSKMYYGSRFHSCPFPDTAHEALSFKGISGDSEIVHASFARGYQAACSYDGK